MSLMLDSLQHRPKLLLTLTTLSILCLAAAEYADLLPYPGMAAGTVGPSHIPLPSQGIIGHVSLGPLTPVCYINGTRPTLPAQPLFPSGIVYGHGLALNVPISWKFGSCGAYGEFQVTLYTPGVYHFTLSGCTSTAQIGCQNLPVNVDVLPFQMADITVYIDTGIR